MRNIAGWKKAGSREREERIRRIEREERRDTKVGGK